MSRGVFMNKKKDAIAESIGEKIRYAREEAGISQRELGQILQVSDKAISSYEVGRTIPSIRVLKEIGNVVHKPISYFDDSEPNDIDLQIKIKTIERELLEIKKILEKRQGS